MSEEDVIRLVLNEKGLTTLAEIDIPETVTRLFLYANRLGGRLQENIWPPRLTFLNLVANGITDADLEKTTFPDSLVEIYLDKNCLTDIRCFRFPHSLVDLWFDDNQLESISGIDFPDTIKNLSFDRNRIVTLEGVQFPPHLNALWLADNLITDLEGAIFPKSLRSLYLNGNRIKSLAGTSFNDGLMLIQLKGNPITSLEWIQLPESLIILAIDSVEEMNKVGLYSPLTPVTSWCLTHLKPYALVTCAKAILRAPKERCFSLQAWWVRTSYMLGGVAYWDFDALLYNKGGMVPYFKYLAHPAA